MSWALDDSCGGVGGRRQHRVGLRVLLLGPAPEPDDFQQFLRCGGGVHSPRGLGENAGRISRARSVIPSSKPCRREGVDGARAQGAKLKELKLPTMLIAGTADLSTPPSISRMIAAEIPNSRLALMPEAGHSSYWEQPEIFNRAVLDFIGSQSK